MSADTSLWHHDDITMMSQHCPRNVKYNPRHDDIRNDITKTSHHHPSTSTSSYVTMTSQSRTRWQKSYSKKIRRFYRMSEFPKETPSVCMMSQWCHQFGCVTNFWVDVSKKVRTSERNSEVSKETPKLRMTSQWHHSSGQFQVSLMTSPRNSEYPIETPILRQKLRFSDIASHQCRRIQISNVKFKFPTSNHSAIRVRVRETE